MEAEVKTVGVAVHVHSDGSWSELSIKAFLQPSKNDLLPFVTIGSLGDSIIVNSREQWKQVQAMVEAAFKEIEDDFPCPV